jgi:carbamoyl-phosphate synthase large subunit
MRVLMSAAASTASVSIVRHLRALGHTVVGIDSAADAAPLGRAFCDAFYTAPLAGAPGFLNFLEERLADVDVFLPFIDEELLVVAQAWEKLATDSVRKIAVCEPAVVFECVDKCRFQLACELAGLPIAPAAVAPPAVFKPRFGRGGKGVMAVDDAAMFAAVRAHDGVVQRLIRGEEFTVDAVFDTQGRLIASVPRRRVRASGVSTIGEVVADPALHELAARLGDRWSFRYAINFQVIRDSSGNDWIIELNPRLSGSAIFSALAGCDPIAATLAIWAGQPWSGQPHPLRVWRYWQELIMEPPPP